MDAAYCTGRAVAGVGCYRMLKSGSETVEVAADVFMHLIYTTDLRERGYLHASNADPFAESFDGEVIDWHFTKRAGQNYQDPITNLIPNFANIASSTPSQKKSFFCVFCSRPQFPNVWLVIFIHSKMTSDHRCLMSYLTCPSKLCSVKHHLDIELSKARYQ